MTAAKKLERERAAPMVFADYDAQARHALERRSRVGVPQCAVAQWADEHLATIGAEELYVAMQLADANRLDQIASGPELCAFANALRQDAVNRARLIDDERRAILAALESSDARILAAFRWWGEEWRDSFRRAAGREYSPS